MYTIFLSYNDNWSIAIIEEVFNKNNILFLLWEIEIYDYKTFSIIYYSSFKKNISDFKLYN